MNELDEDGLERVDGKPVKVYETRFTGAIDLDPEDAADISSGVLVAFVVTARAAPPKFSEMPLKKGGGIKRVNSFKLQGLIPLDVDRATQVLDQLDVQMVGVNDPDSIVETTYVVPEQEQELGFDPNEAMLWQN